MPPKVRNPRAVAKKAAAVTPKAKNVRASIKPASLTGTISHQFDGVMDMDREGQRSDIVMIGGYAWCLWMCRFGGVYPELFIECLEGDHSPVWHVDFEFELTIFDAGYGMDWTEEKEETVHMKRSIVRSEHLDRYMLKNFGGDDDVDYVDAKCVITVKEAKGDRFRAKPTSDIFTPNDQIYNCALDMGGMKIYVNKQYLSFHSVFFKDFFFGKGKKGDEKEMKVDGVKPEDFAVLLSYLYRMEDITVHNFDVLVKMAKQFQIQDVLDSAEYFLMENDEAEIWSNGKKIETAEKYGMDSYKEVAVDDIEEDDIEALMKSKEYRRFSEELKERFEKKAEDIRNRRR